MKTLLEICESVADLCLTARPKKLEGEWLSIVESTLVGLKIAFHKRNIVWNSYGFVEKSDNICGDDFPLFDEEIVKSGIMWRWLKRNGREYVVEFDDYCKLLEQEDKPLADMTDEEFEQWLDEFYNVAVQAKLTERNLMNPAKLFKRFGEQQ